MAKGDDRTTVPEVSSLEGLGLTSSQVSALQERGLDSPARIARTPVDRLVELVPELDRRQAEAVKDKATDLAFPLGWRRPDPPG
jgi:hypothetical protein